MLELCRRHVARATKRISVVFEGSKTDWNGRRGKNVVEGSCFDGEYHAARLVGVFSARYYIAGGYLWIEVREDLEEILREREKERERGVLRATLSRFRRSIQLS